MDSSWSRENDILFSVTFFTIWKGTPGIVLIFGPFPFLHDQFPVSKSSQTVISSWQEIFWDQFHDFSRHINLITVQRLRLWKFKMRLLAITDRLFYRLLDLSAALGTVHHSIFLSRLLNRFVLGTLLLIGSNRTFTHANGLFLLMELNRRRSIYPTGYHRVLFWVLHCIPYKSTGWHSQEA